MDDSTQKLSPDAPTRESRGRRQDALADHAPGAPLVVAQLTDDTYARGTPLGRYLVLELLGQGGMGRVYLAYDPQLDRRVAVKLMLPSDDGHPQERLLREARAMARLTHPNVVAVHDVGQVGGRVFVAMEYVEGQTVKAWLAAAPRTPDEVMRVFREAARGLQAAHAKGLVHRDFKPENVLVDRGGRVLVTDFGLARLASEVPGLSQRSTPALRVGEDSLTLPGLVAGTPRYMPPEQLRAEPCDARSDQFSFCVALWEALYGVHPFGGSSPDELLERVVAGAFAEPPRRAGVPRWLQAALKQGLAADPGARLPSMQAWERLLARSPRRRKGVLLAAAGIVLSAAVPTGVALRRMAEGPARCAEARSSMDAAWSPDVRASAAKAFAHEGQLGLDAWARAEGLVDSLAARWREASGVICGGPPRVRRQALQLLRQQLACLEERTAELAALTRTWSGADRQVVNDAVGAVSTLGSPDLCLRLAPQSWVSTLGDEDRAVHERSQRVLAEALVLLRLGQARESDRKATGVAEETEHRGLPRDASRAWAAAAAARAASSALASADEAVMRALLIAERDGDPYTLAQAWIERAGLDAAFRSRPEAALEWTDHAAAALSRAGPEPRLEVRLESTRGLALQSLGRDDEAVAAHRAAVALEQQLSGEGLALARALTNLGNALRARRNADEALLAHERALAIRNRLLPPGDVQRASSHNGKGRALLALGRPSEALDQHRVALKILEQAWPGPHLDRVRTLALVGEAHRALGELGTAATAWRLGLEMAEALVGADHVLRRSLQLDLGRAQLELGEFQGAVKHLGAALDGAAPGAERGRLLGELAEAEQRTGNPQAARLHAQESLAVLADGWVRYQLAQALRDLKDPLAPQVGRQALAELEEASDRRSERVRAWLAARR